MKYEILEHTADVKFCAYGSNLEEVFSNAILATTAISKEPSSLKQVRKKTIILESKSLESLLFDLIDQIIFLIDTENFISAKVEKISIERQKEFIHLNASLLGDDASKTGSNLKAPTYSEMFVREDDEGWCLQAVIDI